MAKNIKSEYAVNWRQKNEKKYTPKSEITLVYESIPGGGGGGIVDSELSETSENPVQNKVIAKALGDIESALRKINDGE